MARIIRKLSVASGQLPVKVNRNWYRIAGNWQLATDNWLLLAFCQVRLLVSQIVLRVAQNRLLVVVAELLAHLARYAHYQRTGRNHRLFGNQGTRGDDRT